MKPGDRIQCRERGWHGVYLEPGDPKVHPCLLDSVWVQWDGIPGPSPVKTAQLEPERLSCWERIMAN